MALEDMDDVSGVNAPGANPARSTPHRTTDTSEVVMPESRKVAVLGPIPHDHITTHRGEVIDKYGCALYTVAALASLLGPDDVVCPIVNIRQRDEEHIKEALSQFDNVDLTGIRSDSDRGDVIELTYTAHNRRDERQTGFMHPISPAHVEFALDADVFVGVSRSPTTSWRTRRWPTSGRTARAPS